MCARLTSRIVIVGLVQSACFECNYSLSLCFPRNKSGSASVPYYFHAGMTTMEVCVICLSSPPCVTLSPCSHTHLCASCAVRLELASCPACRRSIVSAYFATSPRPHRDFPALLAARRARDQKARDATAQVLLAGPKDGENMATELVKRWRDMFAGAQKRRWRRREEKREVCREERDELQGLPYSCRFDPNANVEGTPVRFSWLRLPDSKVRCSRTRAMPPCVCHRVSFDQTRA